MRKIGAIITGGLMAMAALVILNIPGTSSQAIRDARDCNTNSIIYCGALSQDELLKKYDENKTKDLHAIYSYYGISRDDLAGKTSQIKIGKVHKDGRVVVDGKTVATGAHSVGREKSANSKAVTINGKTYYERTNADGFQSDYIDAFVLMRNGQFYRAVLTSCSNPLVAVPIPKPEYSCEAIQADKISRTEYRFTASAKAVNGAKVTGYHFDFGDGESQKSAKAAVTHTYKKAGTYKVKVMVEVKVGENTKTVTSTACETTIIVDESPLYTCDALTSRVIKLEDRRYEYALDYTAENGVTLKNVAYDFGDGTKEVYEADKATPVEHAYVKDGTYKTVATLTFGVEGQEVQTTEVTCETTVTISPEVCEINPSLPKGDENCAPCPIEGKEQYPKDSPQCKETPVVPAELPKTGAGTLVGGLGLGLVVGATYYWLASRRNLAEALRQK